MDGTESDGTIGQKKDDSEGREDGTESDGTTWGKKGRQ